MKRLTSKFLGVITAIVTAPISVADEVDFTKEIKPMLQKHLQLGAAKMILRGRRNTSAFSVVSTGCCARWT